MSKHDDQVYLNHILEAADKINRLINRGGKELYQSDFAISDAMVRELQVIGEAARHLSEKVKERYSEIPWKDVVGMRDWLVHGYAEIDWERVWNTATEDLPPLVKTLLKDRSI